MFAAGRLSDDVKDDRFRDLANYHETLRAFLGHSDFGGRLYYEYETVLDNLLYLTPELLLAIDRLVLERGHAVARNRMVNHC